MPEYSMSTQSNLGLIAEPDWHRLLSTDTGAQGGSMKALVLEKAGHIALRDIQIEEHLGAGDVRIKVHTAGRSDSVSGADSSRRRHAIRPGY